MKRLVLAVLTLGLAVFVAAIGAQAADVTVGHSGWNWGNPLPQGNTLRAVEFDGSLGFAAGDFGTLIRTTDGGGTWFPRTTSTLALNGVYFPSAGTGYAVGAANTVLKTKDGGENWDPQPVDDTIPSADLTSIRCASNSTCIAATDSGDRVIRTTNGGNSYTAFSPAAQKIY